jgi:hypothetical protein
MAVQGLVVRMAGVQDMVAGRALPVPTAEMQAMGPMLPPLMGMAALGMASRAPMAAQRLAVAAWAMLDTAHTEAATEVRLSLLLPLPLARFTPAVA